MELDLYLTQSPIKKGRIEVSGWDVLSRCQGAGG